MNSIRSDDEIAAGKSFSADAVGVLDLFFQTAEALSEAVIDKLTMFGEEVLPRIREV